jgi:hypothetical protein
MFKRIQEDWTNDSLANRLQLTTKLSRSLSKTPELSPPFSQALLSLLYQNIPPSSSQISTIFIYCLHIQPPTPTVIVFHVNHFPNEVFINEVGNELAQKAVDVAINYIKKTPSLGLSVEVMAVEGNRTDSKGLLESICSRYAESLTTGK